MSVADPGFPMGGHAPVRRGRGPPTWALFSENVCKNERIGSHRGGVHLAWPPPRSANECEYYHLLGPLGVNTGTYPLTLGSHIH